jgi:hypothetical protein
MTVKKRKLLFSGEPLSDESFVGYLLRLAQLNDFDSLSWALQMAEILDHAHHYGFVFHSSLNLAPLTSLTGVEEVKLKDGRLLSVRQGCPSVCDSPGTPQDMSGLFARVRTRPEDVGPHPRYRMSDSQVPTSGRMPELWGPNNLAENARQPLSV